MSGERSEGQILPGVYAEQMPPGRGRVVRRGDRPRIVQIADARAPLDDETDTRPKELAL
jgi:S-DNA-T family DNA segregation ATPase FtsK/SpoIIIE